MKIALSDSVFLFAFFYILSFTVAFVLIVVFSIRRQIPLRSVLLMMTIVSLLTIIGSRLFTIPISEWGRVITTGYFAEYQSRSAVGGILFGLAGLLFSMKLLKLGKPVLDLYAWIAPVGFGIQKIGCFMNGCCYGKPSVLPWSIQYTHGTSAHFHHWANGMIEENAAYSLSVHPVQLYEAIILFTIAYIVWRTQKMWKKSGSTLLFALFLFCIFRFSIEFLRDSDSSNFSSNIFMGVRIFQWYLLIFGIICGLVLFLYEKILKPFYELRTLIEPSLNKSVIYICVVSVIIYLFRGLYTPFELVSLDIKFIPAILLTAYHVYKSITIVKLRMATTAFFVLPVFLISQTLSQDSIKFGLSARDFYQNRVKTYKRIDVGTGFGNYYSTLQYNPHEGQCGTVYTTEDYKHVIRMAGAGYSVFTRDGKTSTIKGINLYGGVDKEIKLPDLGEKSHFIIGVNPYFRYDMNWLGIGLGVHLGNLLWVPQNPIPEMTVSGDTKFTIIMPEVYARLGRRDIVDLKYTFGSNFPAAFPVLTSELSLGSGFGLKRDASLRYGVAFSKYDVFSFLSAEGLVNKQIGLTFKYSIGHSQYYGEANKFAGRILLGFNYRFGIEK
jgi:prolipoprotein diacylglyceryltransferase